MNSLHDFLPTPFSSTTVLIAARHTFQSMNLSRVCANLSLDGHMSNGICSTARNQLHDITLVRTKTRRRESLAFCN
ncbi:hypothetical protein E4T56_gene2956 [Termitomyces sp. T112]|nr:hypothetical protein E4T56_gene2956 [Termitomyces sp. T112]